jgi:hypothetical protein
MRHHRPVIVAAAVTTLIGALVLLAHSRVPEPPLSVLAWEDGVFLNMAGVSVAVSNRTTRPLHCWVSGFKAKSKDDQRHLRLGLCLLSICRSADLGPRETAVMRVPVPSDHHGEFCVEVSCVWSSSWESPLRPRPGWLYRIPIIGRWFPLEKKGYWYTDGGRYWRSGIVVPSQWMKAPNNPDAPNASITPRFQSGLRWRGVGDPGRSAGVS